MPRFRVFGHRWFSDGNFSNVLDACVHVGACTGGVYGVFSGVTRQSPTHVVVGAVFGTGIGAFVGACFVPAVMMAPILVPTAVVACGYREATK